MSISPSYVDGLELRIKELGKQVEKRTKERDEALERERNCAIATHRQAYCIQQCASIIGPDTSATIDGLPKAVKRVTEKLAALAEQNEKMRKVLLRLACLGNGDQYGNSIGNCIAQEALSLPDLASPVLNRIRAEGVRKASTFISLVRNDWASAGDNLSVQAAEYLISALDARAAELEKTNG